MRRLAVTLIAFLIIFGGAWVVYRQKSQKLQKNNLPKENITNNRAVNVPSANQKSGTTTKIGVLSKSGNRFFLKELEEEAIEVDSYKFDLNTYIGHTITAKGQYSGDTLFISEIQF